MPSISIPTTLYAFCCGKSRVEMDQYRDGISLCLHCGTLEVMLWMLGRFNSTHMIEMKVGMYGSVPNLTCLEKLGWNFSHSALATMVLSGAILTENKPVISFITQKWVGWKTSLPFLALFAELESARDLLQTVSGGTYYYQDGQHCIRSLVPLLDWQCTLEGNSWLCRLSC